MHTLLLIHTLKSIFIFILILKSHKAFPDWQRLSVFGSEPSLWFSSIHIYIFYCAILVSLEDHLVRGLHFWIKKRKSDAVLLPDVVKNHVFQFDGLAILA